MNLVIEIISGLSLLIGCFLCLSGGVGMLRFPDFYTRMHAVSVTDTLGACLVLFGLMLQSPNGLVLIKLILILLCTLFINPSASHALAKAALRNGLLPLEGKPDNQGGNKPSKL
ncbi:monovalent cation/H(+) antiporter subunit G [Shewanella sp. 1_MG-2023]|jgi:multicomponent Na+:H+ antiporter subunit G|uniref:Monovalent cation/H(+) antiporter subunit G n=1 Tax=Shewanella electrodiphila TaxID=934143 RepID=A0ABT0KNQ8_9GAMM|nr:MULTISPECIES: monovalent cation/H(+) antiporter subunit G [Shewanella]MCC4832515.1 monovalent cation/H(+) antiporter subunit G [Shewanella sp. 10N.7]MCL1045409.1 monovalent cation/H(+) antiporter subunit G [Shewanella electrodiphila]MDO6611371.1 monovalent cation/H(+) antiporter subunit G [Shewanella sp. 7_MG-2023]MDO6771226.1 monovalent cation/H(+) antiporter subunit G [Shewanella sp. 2_MG-2023]MDO6795467.1 monovalent cation/H(+) antiporter subunit G [Shewanella sp. 1_MG-2023]